MKKKMSKGKVILIIVAVLIVLNGIGEITGYNQATREKKAQETAQIQAEKDAKQAEDDASAANYIKASSYVNKNAAEAYTELIADGFTVVMHEKDSSVDITSDVASSDSEWIIKEITKVGGLNMEVEFIVTKKPAPREKTEEEKLEDVLDPYAAFQAAEREGEKTYVYGFKIHSLIGVLAKEARGDTWFLKATCTVTNAFGQKSDMVCEAEVTGTTENPKVVSIIVY